METFGISRVRGAGALAIPDRFLGGGPRNRGWDFYVQPSHDKHAAQGGISGRVMIEPGHGSAAMGA